MIAVKKSGSACENEMARTTKVVPTKRTRADTSALLLPGGDEQKVEAPLKPEDDLDKYDRERLQQGLRYVKGAAKRMITPCT